MVVVTLGVHEVVVDLASPNSPPGCELDVAGTCGILLLEGFMNVTTAEMGLKLAVGEGLSDGCTLSIGVEVGDEGLSAAGSVLDGTGAGIWLDAVTGGWLDGKA